MMTEKGNVLFTGLLTDEELLTLQQVLERNKESWRRRPVTQVDISWAYYKREEALANPAYKAGEDSRAGIEVELIIKHAEEASIFIPVRHYIVERMTNDVVSARMSITHFRNGTIPISKAGLKQEEEYYSRFGGLSDGDKLRFAERQLKLLDVKRFLELSRGLSEEELKAAYGEIVKLISMRDDQTDRYFSDRAFGKLEEAAKKK